MVPAAVTPDVTVLLIRQPPHPIAGAIRTIADGVTTQRCCAADDALCFEDVNASKRTGDAHDGRLHRNGRLVRQLTLNQT